MKHIIARFTSELPAFFKRVRFFGMSLSATGTTLVSIPGIPDNVKNYAGHAIWIGLAMAAVAQLTCANPEELKK